MCCFQLIVGGLLALTKVNAVAVDTPTESHVIFSGLPSAVKISVIGASTTPDEEPLSSCKLI